MEIGVQSALINNDIKYVGLRHLGGQSDLMANNTIDEWMNDSW